MPKGNFAQLPQDGRRRGYRARACPYRFDHHGSHIAASCQNARYSRDIVRLDQDDIRSDLRKHTGGRRAVEVLLYAERRMIVPTVEVAHEAHDLALAARGARKADREVRSFVSRGS